MAEKVRYVDGGLCDSSGKRQWVEIWVGFRLVATFIGYSRKPEDASIMIYPYKVAYPDLLPHGKKRISKLELQNR